MYIAQLYNLRSYVKTSHISIAWSRSSLCSFSIHDVSLEWMLSHVPEVLACSLEKNNNDIQPFGTVVVFSLWNNQLVFWAGAKAEILLSLLGIVLTYFCGEQNYGHRRWIEIWTDLPVCANHVVPFSRCTWLWSYYITSWKACVHWPL